MEFKEVLCNKYNLVIEFDLNKYSYSDIIDFVEKTFNYSFYLTKKTNNKIRFDLIK